MSACAPGKGRRGAAGPGVLRTARARRPRRQRSYGFRALRSPHASRSNGPDPATADTSTRRPPRCPRTHRPNLDRPATSGQFQKAREPVGRHTAVVFTPVRPCLFRAALGSAARPARAREGLLRHPRTGPRGPPRAGSTHGPGGVARPRTGPPPAGNEATVFPQPTASSAAGRPTQHPCKRSRRGRARAHGRAHGHTPGARTDTPDEGSGESRRGRTDRAPDAPPHTGSGWSAGGSRSGPHPCAAPGATSAAAVHPLPGVTPAISAKGRGRAPQSLLSAPAFPPPFLRAAFASRSPTPPLLSLAPPDSPLFTVRWPVRTTIPPYGRPALNGRDAANYAGFTDVLSRAAYSSGLGQMRVRPECRGSSLGRTRYECRAPHR